MSQAKPKIGHIAWTDLTVKSAAKVSDFYAAVVGWKITEVDMGGYADYGMNRPADGQTVAGVCHAREQTPTSRRSGSSTSTSPASKRASPAAANLVAR